MSSEPWLGFQFPPKKVSWLKRDVLLFANSVNVKADDIHFLYELDKNFQVLPSYPTVLAQKGTNIELIDFYSDFDKNNAGIPIPGVPTLDVKRMVDAGRTMTFHKPIPATAAGRDFEQRMRVIGVYDKGKAGTLIQTETALVDATNNEVYTCVIGNNFYLAQGGWGGPRGPAPINHAPPKRPADITYSLPTSKETALLYRLNGDSNPLHAIPEPGIALGFKGAIIHGLWTYNATLYAVLKSVGGSQSGNIKSFQAKFASPLRPGDAAAVHIWLLSEFDEQGFEEIRFLVKKEGSGESVLTGGRALVKPAKEAHKL